MISEKRKPIHTSNKTACNNIFEPLPFFMIRSPFLPFNALYQIKNQEVLIKKLREYAEMDYIKEAIAIASPSLLESLKHIHGDLSNRKTQQVISSVLRYMLRMTTRPTPFGAFSGVASGEFKEKSLLEMSHFEQFKKRTRPDMEWLLGVVSSLEKNPSILQSLMVSKNHATYRVGNRLYLPFSTECGQLRKKDMEKKENISISYSEVVRKVLDLAETHITVKELLQKLQNDYPGIEVKVMENFILQLVEQEYLITELRPPLTYDSPFDYVIDKLKIRVGENQIWEDLLKVKDLILVYDQLPLGKGLSVYNNLILLMKRIYEVTTPLQVDFALNTQDLAIGKNVANDVSKAAQVLWSIADSGVGFPHLQKYHIDFLEKYGTTREVPLVELLSEELGLGAPATYKNPKGNRDGENFTLPLDEERNVQLSYMLIEAIHNQQKEIEITDEIISRIGIEKNTRYAPDSFEVYGELYATSQEELDNGKYTLCLSPNPGSHAAGSTFGRFLDILDPNVRRKIQQQEVEIDHQFNNDIVMVEGSFLPATGRSANVAIGKTTREVTVTLGTNGDDDTLQIPIDDIVVGASLENFYLKSKKLGKRIKVVAGNVLNYQSGPNIYRFMREVSLNDLDHWRIFNWGNMTSSPYYPRIRYKNIILSPAIWKLNRETIGMKNKPKSDDEFLILFEKWREKWTVPRHVYMTYSDNRILIDLENILHLRELKNELFKQGRLQLRESLQDINKNCLSSPLGSHAMEVVFPLKKMNGVAKRKSIGAVEDGKKEMVSEKMIYRLPGSEWLYVKLYVPQARENEFISKYMTSFSNYIVQSGMAQSWFFMRYRDPDAHIRLRFYGDPEKLNASVLTYLRDWANNLMDSGFIHKMTVDTYEREVERYGGPYLIELAENFFHYDSRSVTMLLNVIGQQTELPVHVLASLNIIEIMDNFGLTYEQQLETIESNTDKYEFIDEFRPMRKLLSNIGNSEGDWSNLRNYNSAIGQEIYKSLLVRRESLKEYVSSIQQYKNEDMLWNKQQTIMGAIIHMHCNRLLGANRELEKKALAFTRHILSSQRYWRNQNETDTQSRT
ncbi:lantibiotic dehydratase [Bacillus luti]|uniref:lantibiotic dehydratase n=1 Tax=Bacillus luti TaxID=2026191 RepID=UPI003D064908